MAYGAKELGVRVPRVRFFASKGFTFGGITYGDRPHEIWVAADRHLGEQKTIALHELAHTPQFSDGTPRDDRERDAERFSARGRHW